MKGLVKASTLRFLLVIMWLVTGGCVATLPFYSPDQPALDSSARPSGRQPKLHVLVRNFAGESYYFDPGQVTDKLIYALASSDRFDVRASGCSDPPCVARVAGSHHFAPPSAARLPSEHEDVDFIISGKILQADLKTSKGRSLPGIFYYPSVSAVVTVQFELYAPGNDDFTFVKRLTSEEASRRLPQVMTLRSFDKKEASLFLPVAERAALFDRAVSRLADQITDELFTVACQLPVPGEADDGPPRCAGLFEPAGLMRCQRKNVPHEVESRR